MKRIILPLVAAAFLAMPVAASSAENKIEIKDTTMEWSALYSRGVETGKRLNANCANKDWVDAKIEGETVQVCKKYKIFVKSKQFSKSPDAFQLGFLSTLR